MGSILDFESAARGRRSMSAASFGLVMELVPREAAGAPREIQHPRGSTGVIHIGERAKVCVVEHIPAVGDLVHCDVPAVVEHVRIARNGRVAIFARPAAAPEP